MPHLDMLNNLQFAEYSTVFLVHLTFLKEKKLTAFWKKLR